MFFVVSHSLFYCNFPCPLHVYVCYIFFLLLPLCFFRIHFDASHRYHTETRHRQVERTWTDTDGNQRSRWETETYYVTETDFDYRLDLTRFIYPFGYIQPGTKAKGDSVQGQVEKYLQDTNSLKSLNMKKEIAFDFEMLRRQVYGYIRSIG